MDVRRLIARATIPPIDWLSEELQVHSLLARINQGLWASYAEGIGRPKLSAVLEQSSGV